MGWVGDIIKGASGGVIEGIGNTIKKFVTTDADRMQMQKELEEILQKRDSDIESTIRSELTAKAGVLKMELQQGDNYTKRARPTVVYFGLVIIALDFIARAIMMVSRMKGMLVPEGFELPSTMIPQEFWLAWGGIVSTWVIGRSAEKRGTRNKITSFITGS
jgi:hypothetical protein